MAVNLGEMFHYTDRKGYNAIRSEPVWCFKAHQPKAVDHPIGAYFTTCPPDTLNLRNKIRVTGDKIDFVFEFVDVGDLQPLRGGRGQYVLYSESDYMSRPIANFIRVHARSIVE